MPHVSHALRGRRPLHVPAALIAAVAACAVALAPLALPGPARADGDPASDVLLVDNVFYSYAPSVSPALTSALNTAVSRAHAAGFPIKVALIEAPLDLGAIPQLFGKPGAYAKFLDYEISYNSVAKLLVVMPHGFGTYASGPVSALAKIHVDASARSNGLAAAAILAIQRLAQLAGHPISIPSLPGGASAGGSSGGSAGASAVVFVPVVALIALASVAAVMIRRRRRAGAGAAGEGGNPTPTS
jgi:hypothetical protein